MVQVFSFPKRESLSPEKEYEAMWGALQDQIASLIKEGGFHVDYAVTESKRIAGDARARREALVALGKFDPEQINNDMAAFVGGQVRASVGLKPKPV